MSTLIDGTTERRFELSIERGSLIIETANIDIRWGAGVGPSTYVHATPHPTITEISLVVIGCFADGDGSGELDVFDSLCSQDAFAAGDPYADCDDSGALDFFDFLSFQDLFAMGRP